MAGHRALTQTLKKARALPCRTLRILPLLPGISRVRPEARRQNNAEAPGTACPDQVQNPLCKVGAEQIILSRSLEVNYGGHLQA